MYELRIANNKMSGYKQDAEKYGACHSENAALRRRIAELERMGKDNDVASMRERLEYYRMQSEKNDAEIARLKALINELQKIINDLTAWKDSHQGGAITIPTCTPTPTPTPPLLHLLPHLCPYPSSTPTSN